MVRHHKVPMVRGDLPPSLAKFKMHEPEETHSWRFAEIQTVEAVHDPIVIDAIPDAER